MKKFNQDTKVIAAFLPDDLAGGANTGVYVNMGFYDSLTLLYMSEVGTSGQDVTVTLRQAPVAAGTGQKNITGLDWYSAQHATDLPEAKTKTSGNNFEDAGETLCALQVEVTADMLDVAGGFNWVAVHTTDAGTTAGKFGAAFYVLRGGRYITAVEDQPTVTS